MQKTTFKHTQIGANIRQARYRKDTRMPTVTIDGATFNYAVAGEENKRTIFTLHGGRGAGDHKSDFATYSKLADEYRVISFDQRGHGKSSETPPFTFNQLASSWPWLHMEASRWLW